MKQFVDSAIGITTASMSESSQASRLPPSPSSSTACASRSFMAIQVESPSTWSAEDRAVYASWRRGVLVLYACLILAAISVAGAGLSSNIAVALAAVH
jgi:hypothetical protein